MCKWAYLEVSGVVETQNMNAFASAATRTTLKHKPVKQLTCKTTFYNDQPRYNINKKSEKFQKVSKLSEYAKIFDTSLKWTLKANENEETIAKKQKSHEEEPTSLLD